MDEKQVIATPAGFIWRVLLQGQKKLGQWQIDFSNKFLNQTQLVREALVTPNGSGKSSIIVAGLALWWISIFKFGKVVIVSFDSKQLDNQCWPSIEMHKGKFENEQGWKFIERKVETPTGAFIIGFTTDDPGRAEGWHKIDDIDGPLLMLFDESKSIDNRVFEAGERCTYNAIAYISSPGFNEGRFYDACTTLKRSEANPSGFGVTQVGLTDCPWIPKSRIDRTIADFGIDHPFTQSTLFGQFMDSDADTIFIVPRSVAKAALEAKPPYEHGRHAAFCDFAGGRAENVFAYKVGNKIKITAWRDSNTMSACGKFVMLFREHNLAPSEIRGDRGGMGQVFIDRLGELGWPIIPVGNDDAPSNPIYKNKGAEDWHEGSKKLASQQYIFDDDPILYKQWTSRRMDFKGGLLGNESKEDMAKRDVESPDRADAVMGVLGIDTSLASAMFDDEGLRKMEGAARASVPEKGALTVAGLDVTYEANSQNSWLDVWERPISGRSYICVVNPHWHSDVFGHHTVIVVRAGYSDEKGKPVPAKLVAKVRRPCRLDAGPLAQTVLALTRWYGKCFTIPIANERGDVIDKLLSSGIAIYCHEDFEHIKHGRKNRVVQFGWQPNEYNRSLWMGALAEAIRSNAIEVNDLDTVTQMFQVNGDLSQKFQMAEAVGVAVREIVRATRYTYAPAVPFRIERQRDLSKAMIS